MARRRVRPNILLILTDQQSGHMMSCAGTTHLHTPAMDRLAAQGMRFNRAYCTNPVCIPSRFSILSGRMPSEIKLRGNIWRDIPPISDRIRARGAAALLRKGGYRTAYGGKVHLPGLTPTDIGFDEIISDDEREGLAAEAARFVGAAHEQPFFLVTSFINPHDICLMAIRDSQQEDWERMIVDKCRVECETVERAMQPPAGVNPAEFVERFCPPLPPNFEPQMDEPEGVALALLKDHPFRLKARREWPEARWRLHRWAYARLTELVDAQIAQVLDALRAAGRERDTLVIFTSDHGDMDSAHRLEHKSMLFEEAIHVPLIVSQPGVTVPGVDSRLVSNGLDILPTLCDYAGVRAPADLRGASLRAPAEGRPPRAWRDAVLVENRDCTGVVTRQHKYVLYDAGAQREQLMDRAKDPWEMHNVARDPAMSDVLADMRFRLDSLRP